jgi:hypothetical protein
MQRHMVKKPTISIIKPPKTPFKSPFFAKNNRLKKATISPKKPPITQSPNDDVWKQLLLEKHRHVFTRFALHGFHNLLCNQTSANNQ